MLGLDGACELGYSGKFRVVVVLLAEEIEHILKVTGIDLESSTT